MTVHFWSNDYVLTEKLFLAKIINNSPNKKLPKKRLNFIFNDINCKVNIFLDAEVFLK